MTDLKTDPALIALLEECARRPITRDEVWEQKVSWAYGQAMECAPERNKEQVREHLEKYR